MALQQGHVEPFSYLTTPPGQRVSEAVFQVFFLAQTFASNPQLASENQGKREKS